MIHLELKGWGKRVRNSFNHKHNTPVKILLVDDDPIVILLQKKLMEKVGMIDEVESFSSGEEALGFLGNHMVESKYLIFLDINMPGLSGWQVLDKLIELKFHGNISVIIITSSIEQSEMEKSKNYDQIIDFWIKPFNFQSFMRLKEHKITRKFFKEA